MWVSRAASRCTGLRQIQRGALGSLTVAALLFLVALLSPPVRAVPDSTVDVGESIYRRGVLGSGDLLEGSRGSGVRTEGADAACVNCHRRSGFGAKEGRIFIPPVTGRYLFRSRDRSPEDLDLPYVDGMRADRQPYTEATLARAIREGLDAEGRPLDYLMPRFTLSDADMEALIGYLKRLDRRKVPGVTDSVLHFATIVTPDADPVKRQGMLDVLERYFADKNAFQRGPSPRLTSSRKMMFKTSRRWELHVWQLTGPAATWQEQLRQHFAEQPVLAVVSGLGGKTWIPVHAFCEHQAVPCLFPNMEVPVVAERDFYSLYFSKGVLLEADLIAKRILEPAEGEAAKVVHQIYRADDSGESAAPALAAVLERHGIRVRSHALAKGAPGKGTTEALRRASSVDTLVMWLRPADIAALGKPPAGIRAVFMSGLMGGLERAPLPANWREQTHIAYPFGLPAQRRINVNYALGWFGIRHIPVVAEQVQADTYLACGLLSEALSHLADTFVPDYLVERLQDMLERRIVTGYYPRLALASGQRFASKGGYIVHFPEPEGARVIAENDWIVP